MKKTGADAIVVPDDLLIEILKRLPVKSLCRFRCVSTLWRSVISDPQFIDAHLAQSANRPRLLVSLPVQQIPHPQGRWLLSADHPESGRDRPQTAIPHLLVPGSPEHYVSQSLNGLICLEVGGWISICNPSTRKLVTLEQIKEKSGGVSFYRRHSFGFDPVGKEHKVFKTLVSGSGKPDRGLVMDQFVFTLGSNEWRRIEGGPPHVKHDPEICFNGVIYYIAWKSLGAFPRGEYLVALDVRTESFRMIANPSGTHVDMSKRRLIEFEGHVALVDCSNLRSDEEVHIWILEDFDREIWQKKVVVLPPCWKEIVADHEMFPAGMVRSTGELLFEPWFLWKPVCLFYYSPKTNSFRISEIGGFPEYESGMPPEMYGLTFTDHVESLLPVMSRSSKNIANHFPSG
ncbi:F-box domain-containing protein [Psidium guajava]|nr:F-box domain-containing protein [Psidium guajava]